MSGVLEDCDSCWNYDHGISRGLWRNCDDDDDDACRARDGDVDGVGGGGGKIHELSSAVRS